jgi:hypothetical protein
LLAPYTSDRITLLGIWVRCFVYSLQLQCIQVARPQTTNLDQIFVVRLARACAWVSMTNSAQSRCTALLCAYLPYIVSSRLVTIVVDCVSSGYNYWFSDAIGLSQMYSISKTLGFRNCKPGPTISNSELLQ